MQNNDLCYAIKEKTFTARKIRLKNIENIKEPRELL